MVILRYTLLRVLVFGVVAALLWLVGLRGFVLLLAAVLLSGILSMFVLSRSRDRLSSSLDRRLSTIKDRSNHEDAWDDARRAEQEGTEEVDSDQASTEPPGQERSDSSS